MRKAFVGIDPSVSNTGVVCLDMDGRFRAALNGRDLVDRRQAYGIRRHVDQVAGICRFLADFSIIALAYEDYSYGSVHRAYTLAEFNGILKAGLLDILPPPLFVAPTVNKKFATGYGQAAKEDVIFRVENECPELANLPKKQRTSDICDAWSLARMAWYVNMPEHAATIDFGCDLLRTRLEVAASIREKYQVLFTYPIRVSNTESKTE